MKYAKEHAKDVKMHQFNGAVKNDGKISVLVLGADKAQSGKSHRLNYGCTIRLY